MNLLLTFTSSRVMLHGASAKRQTLSYFQNPKSSYDHFINKMWIKRETFSKKKKNLFFGQTRNGIHWMTRSALNLLLPAPTPSKAKNKITNFFKSVAKKRIDLPNVLIALRKVVKVPVMRLMSTFLIILQTQLLH